VPAGALRDPPGLALHPSHMPRTRFPPAAAAPAQLVNGTHICKQNLRRSLSRGCVLLLPDANSAVPRMPSWGPPALAT
jgi:hypothetical protein